jgi:transcriptional regulator with XRE-family HTH domain
MATEVENVARQRIIQLREEHNLSQKQLAEKLSIDKRTLANWESGKTSPHLFDCLDIADFFGISRDSFFEGDDRDNNSINKE